MLKKNDFLIIVVVILIAAALGATAYFMQRNPQTPDNLQTLPDDVIVTSEPTPSQEPAQAPQASDEPVTTGAPAATDEAAAAPAAAYLLVSVGEPIPLLEEGDFTLYQNDQSTENVVHVTRDSVCMKSASCDNQDCVQQGTVTLDNRDLRVLQNMIVCLPNQVMLELLTAEEAAAMTQ